jgi:hypothetical protein
MSMSGKCLHILWVLRIPADGYTFEGLLAPRQPRSGPLGSSSLGRSGSCCHGGLRPQLCWVSGGGCSGTGTCVVTIEAGTVVTATFNANPPLPPPAAKPVLVHRSAKCKKGKVKRKGKCVKKHKKHHHRKQKR